MTIKRCKNCKHWRPHHNDETGYCRFYMIWTYKLYGPHKCYVLYKHHELHKRHKQCVDWKAKKK